MLTDATIGTACIGDFYESPRYLLRIGPDFSVSVYHRRRWWFRLWQRAFLGFTYEPIN